MAIAPIDLQTMYSQMSNVAKIVADRQQGGQLASQMQQASVVRQNSEKLQSVRKAAENETKSDGVKDDGKGSTAYSQQDKRQTDSQESDENKPKETEIREAYLGRHVDISR